MFFFNQIVRNSIFVCLNFCWSFIFHQFFPSVSPSYFGQFAFRFPVLDFMFQVQNLMHFGVFASTFCWKLCERCLYSVNTKKRQTWLCALLALKITRIHAAILVGLCGRFCCCFFFFLVFLCFHHINFASMLSNELFSLHLCFCFGAFSFFKFVRLNQC